MRDFFRKLWNCMFLLVSFQSNNCLHIEPYIQLRVAKFYAFVCHSFLCNHVEAQFCFVMKPKLLTAKYRFNALRYLKYVQWNDKKVSMGCKNIRESQGKISIMSLKISVKIREFFPEMVVATLRKVFRLLILKYYNMLWLRELVFTLKLIHWYKTDCPSSLVQ